jgi:methionyl aminopeptidase
MAPVLKDAWELDLMRRAGSIVARTLALVTSRAKPGVTTAELDRVGEAFIRGEGAYPTFKGYRVGSKTFPASLCLSINEEVVHGIPSERRTLQEGDILSIDCGATYKNYIGDAAVTIPIGRVSPAAARLIESTRAALEAGIAAIRPGGRLRDISASIQEFAESRGYTLVKLYCGHGVGQKLHEEPQVPNYVNDAYENMSLRLKPGLVLAIEPMLNEGGEEVEELEDRWTVVTADGKLSAHFEHTVAITADGPRVLTLP